LVLHGPLQDDRHAIAEWRGMSCGSRDVDAASARLTQQHVSSQTPRVVIWSRAHADARVRRSLVVGSQLRGRDGAAIHGVASNVGGQGPRREGLARCADTG
jgi:hypothetical protein